MNHQETKYYCPMKCEGDKTYDEPGNCPVCNMHLVPVGANGQKHEHTHHEHHHAEHGHQGHGGHEHNHPDDQGIFYCPMKCEGDKTYNEPGDCPVCGMHLVPEGGNVEHSHTHDHSQEHHQGHDHSGHIHDHEKYGKPGAVYYCPMRCEGDKTYDQPGDCPKCGMTLVPEKGEEVSEEELAYKKMAKKFWIAVGFSLPVFIISMSDYINFIDFDAIAPRKVWNWVQFILATPVVFYSSWDFFKRGYASVIRRSPNMWTLISIGVGAAYLFSVFAMFFPSVFPVAGREGHLERPHDIFLVTYSISASLRQG